MALRFYLMPSIGDGSSMENARRPKYLTAMAGADGGWMDFGFNPVFLVGMNLSAPQDTSLVSNADVFAFPFNLQATISGGAVNTRKSILETFFIPGDGVVSGMTEQACIRYVAGLFQFMQRLNFHLGNEVFIDTLAKLNIQWSTVPVDPYQTAILAAAHSLGYDTSFITGTTQMRMILRNFADQWGNQIFRFGPFSL